MWLDRGELEKLIHRATLEPYGPDSDRYESRERGSLPRSPPGDYRHRPPRKRHWLESLGELFD